MAATRTAWPTKSLDRPLWDEFQVAQQMGLTNLGTYNPNSRLPGSGKPSDHAVYPSHAFDVGGPSSKLEAFFAAMVNRPGVEYVIYRDKIWSRQRGIHTYTAGGHDTHVHVSESPGAKPGQPGPTPKPDFNTAKNLPGARNAFLGSVTDALPSAGTFGDIGHALAWPFENWDRILEVLAGSILVIIGLVLLGRSMGVGKMGGSGGSSSSGYDPLAAQAAAEERAYNRTVGSQAGRERAIAERKARPSDEIPY